MKMNPSRTLNVPRKQKRKFVYGPDLNRLAEHFGEEPRRYGMPEPKRSGGIGWLIIGWLVIFGIAAGCYFLFSGRAGTERNRPLNISPEHSSSTAGTP